MKKFILSTFAFTLGFFSFAQAWVSDSVEVPGFAKKVYYSLDNGVVGEVATNNYDLEISTTLMSSTIRLNGGGPSGVTTRLYYVVGDDTTAWANPIDTTGMASGASSTLIRCLDSDSIWQQSAFEFDASGHPDYGWGVYNSSTHNLVGKRIFVMKTHDGTWKRIWIRRLLSSQGIYHIRMADLDGSNESDFSVNKASAGKNFVNYSLNSASFADAEPDAQTFDLIFQRYVDANPNSATVGLAVTGVLQNDGVESVKAAGLPADDADISNYILDTKVNEIGDNWKKLNYVSLQWDVFDSTSYFIKDIPGNIWQLRFTKFGGSASGKYVFEKRQIAYASIEESNPILAFAAFPNPATSQIQLVFNSNTASSVSIQLLDLSGRVVLQENYAAQIGLNQKVVNLSQVQSSGVYFLRLQDGKTLRSEKIIIQK